MPDKAHAKTDRKIEQMEKRLFATYFGKVSPRQEQRKKGGLPYPNYQ